ncbi:hypothetical protein [Paenibacillus prosopidis]|uniref:hypothetical protein n=1 Tax=Paenibacillus prosopidis TaxID=630520 RepID=UPI000DF29F8D|nr:hypothetical protein [Paenibacillus prosopidis]
MKNWENVGRALTIFIVLTFLSSYLDEVGISLWLKYVCIIFVLFGVFIFLSKIKILQKEVSNKVAVLTIIGWFAAIAVFYLLY